MRLSCSINGRPRRVDIDPSDTLLQVLRERLDLRGTKEGCAEGECGACTVLIDGMAVDSCLYLAAAAEGRTVTTIEGIADGELPTDLQLAMLEHGGVQCGFCTPGLVMMITSLLSSEEATALDETAIRSAITGNICRCTGYAQIVAATESVVSLRREAPVR